MSKYGAIRTNGYASKREAARAAELEMLERAGKIKNLFKQVRYQLLKGTGAKGDNGVWYVADFTYWDNERGEEIIEDVKGFKTPVYRLKKKMMQELRGIKIVEA